MSRFKWFYTWEHKHLGPIDENDRKYKLINIITLELFILGLTLIFVDIYLHYWTLSCMIIAAMAVALFNLILVKRNYNFLLCGHIISALFFILISAGSLWLGGLSNSYVGWFYIPPILGGRDYRFKWINNLWFFISSHLHCHYGRIFESNLFNTGILSRLF